jgi:transposase InsO family protein
MSSINDSLKKLYYDGLMGGELKLYKAAKAEGLSVTHKSVKEWLDKQSVEQIHAKPTTIKKFFPIKAPWIDFEWQTDLIDVSRDAHANLGVNYILMVIDIYSRFAWCVPLKDKKTATIISAFTKVLEDCIADKHNKPELLLSDNGSEFISKEFKALMAKNNIKQVFAVVGDHHKLGIGDSFVRNLRRYTEKYKTSAKTDKYITRLPLIVKNYNKSYHSALGAAPNNPNEEFIEKRIKLKESVANLGLKSFKVGDSVRYITNRIMFMKSSKPNWSKTVHKIVEISDNKRVIKLDNGKSYKYYELYNIKGTESYSYPEEKEPDTQGKPIMRKSQRLAIQREGIDPVADITTEAKRIRLPTTFYDKRTGTWHK